MRVDVHDYTGHVFPISAGRILCFDNPREKVRQMLLRGLGTALDFCIISAQSHSPTGLQAFSRNLNMHRRPLIALADPEWIGHRETYFREFVLSLNRVGADVIALCPDSAKLTPLGLHPSSLYHETLTEPQRLPVLRRLFQDPVNTHLRWRLLDKKRRSRQAALRIFFFCPGSIATCGCHFPRHSLLPC
jgi:hypothetical protein